jgi:hypothetical protein
MALAIFATFVIAPGVSRSFHVPSQQMMSLRG